MVGKYPVLSLTFIFQNKEYLSVYRYGAGLLEYVSQQAKLLCLPV